MLKSRWKYSVNVSYSLPRALTRISGGGPFSPRVRLFGEFGAEAPRERAVRRLEAFAAAEATRRFAVLKRLKTAISDGQLKGLARGVAYQLETFERGAEGIAGARSLANSAATLWHPSSHYDWVRPGIILYGASPSGVTAAIDGTGLQPAMTLTSELIAVQTIAKGDTVGYGSIFTASMPMRIGVVACGYADGYPRIAPEGTPVIVDGVRTRVVGRVSMDMITVDLTPCPTANVGARVELWGASLPIDDVARACGTIGYELMCAVAQRVPVRAE